MSPYTRWIWRVLNTTPTDLLSHQVAQWMRQWSKTNPQPRDNRTTRRLRSFDWAYRRPLQFLVILFGVSAAVAVGITLLHHIATVAELMLNQLSICADHAPLPCRLASELPSFQPEPLPWASLESIGTIWSIQATITAVVYPIVLGFVGLILQRRPSARVRLRLYLTITGAKPAGLSAAALVVLIGVGNFILPTQAAVFIEAFAIFTLYWFVIASFLMAHFLYRTLDFFSEDNQLHAIELYARHVALPHEVREQLLVHFFKHAQKLKKLPGLPSYTEFDEYYDGKTAPGPRVDLTGMRETTGCITARNRSTKHLIDIRYRLLRWGMRLWLRKARRTWEPDPSEFGEGASVLEISVVPGRYIDQRTVLVGVSNGPCPSWIATLLIRRGFVLRRAWIPNPTAPDSTSEILRELVDELRESTGVASDAAVDEKLRAVTHVHAALLDQGWLKDGDAPFNAALVHESETFFGGSINTAWLREYDPWLERCCEILLKEGALFGKACHLSQRLIRGLSEQPLKVSIELLDIHRHLFAYLFAWWRQQVETQALASEAATHGIELRPPHRQQYRRAIERVIYGWEQAHLPPLRSKPSSFEEAWTSLARGARFERCKLETLVAELIKAVERNDVEASNAFVESFSNWPERTFHATHWAAWQITDRLSPLTIAVLDQDWASLEVDTTRASGRAQEVTEVAQGIVDHALFRYWTDLRHCVLLLMLRWTNSADVEEPAFGAALRLLRASPHQQNMPEPTDLFNDGNHLLLRLIRQHYARTEYTEKLDAICHGATMLTRMRVRLGRGQTWVGNDDMRALTHELMLLLHALAPDGGFRPEGLEQALLRPGVEFDDRLPSRAEELARSLRQAWETRRQAEPEPGKAARDESIISALRDVAGLQPSPTGTYPWFEVPWVNDAIAWLEVLPARVSWTNRTPIKSPDHLDRGCGWAWRS